MWLTTVDRTQLLTEQAPVAFGDAHSTAPTVVVDPELTFQTMDGFGASITDSTASVLYGLTEDARDRVLRDLFDPAAGIGLSMLRQPIGSSDFTAEPTHYSLDDVLPGETDYALDAFSIARDEARILPLLRRAKEMNPALTIMATPWSPPGWMKTRDSLVGGALIDDQRVYNAYADYLVRFVRAYADAGVPVDYLTVQNEPQNRTPDGYPGMAMPVAQQARVIEALGPRLAAVSPATKILGYDHNWSTHEADIANTPPGEDPETDYPAELLQTPAAAWLAGTAYHCYSGDPAAQTVLQKRFPDKGVWFSECSGSHGVGDPAERVFRDTLTWHARTITVGVPRNWAKSVVTWNLALDENGGPHNGGCGTCTGLLTVRSGITDDTAVEQNAEYFTVGHLAKFVHPGAVRIASTSFGTPSWNGQVTDVAFRNPDGSTVLVAHNENDDPRTFAVAQGSKSFEYTLPGGALATFVWPASSALEDDLHPVDLSAATATASAATAATGDPALAIDADASTRWTPGELQRSGQRLAVDLGAPTAFDRVALDAGGYEGNFARAWRIETSFDGTTWSALAAGASSGQLTEVDVPGTVARHVRFTLTADAAAWWSIADLRLYARGTAVTGEAKGTGSSTGALAATGTNARASLLLIGLLLASGIVVVTLCVRGSRHAAMTHE